MTVAWDTSTLKVLMKDGKICTSCCGYNPGTPTGISCHCELNNNWPRCYPVNETPNHLIAILWNFRDSTTHELVSFNGVYCMEQTGAYGNKYYASWTSAEYGGEGDGMVLEYEPSEYIGRPFYRYISNCTISPSGYGYPIWETDTLTNVECQIAYIPYPYDPNPYPIEEGVVIIINPCKLCEDATIWETAHNYAISDVVKISSTDDFCFVCYAAHLSSGTNVPGTGANWTDYWVLVNIELV